MEKNIIFCFTGTGNSLKVSKDISDALENCSIHNMGRVNIGFDISAHDRIGFIFPVYFLGLPLQVRTFIENLTIPSEFGGYFFSIGTYANMHGNAVKQVNALLQKHGQKLNYAANIKMGDNAIAFYGSSPNLKKLAVSYEHDMMEIIPKIEAQRTRKIGRRFWPAERYYSMVIPRMTNRDSGFHVTDACNQCGVCTKICPVGNTDIENGKPNFHHSCEQCMACIQSCPQKAIDYKGKCARRNRYRHPEIGLNEIIEFNGAAK